MASNTTKIGLTEVTYLSTIFNQQLSQVKLTQPLQIYYADDNKATLVIKEVFPEDAGTFTCVAKNCVGYASSSAELVVQHPLSEHGSLEKHGRWVDTFDLATDY